MSERFDAIIVGTGQAGPYLAGRLTAAGMSVAIVERHLFGGTCVNTGCTPTKTLVASAYAAHLAGRAADYGVMIDGPIRIDLARAKARADAVVKASRDGLEVWLRGMPNCTVIQGHARFEGSRALSVEGRIIEAERVFLNVGGRAVVPQMPGLDQIQFLTNSNILQLESVPKHLAVIGGSYVGLEFAQIYRRFGAQVTVVEKGPHLVGREDEDVSAAVQSILEAEGIAMRLSAECIGFKPHPEGALVQVDCEVGDREVAASHVLMAVGRRPNTDDLGLDKAGVAIDTHGYILVDDQLQASAPGVWAIGDCNGKGAFTHTAYNDFQIVAANLLDNNSRSISDRLPAYALYIDPPLGRVGLTEAQARAAGHRVRISQRPMTRVSRAIEKGETQGFMKFVVEADSDRILGASILGPGGDEAIHGVLDTMYAGGSARMLRRSMPIHPTVSELIPTVLGELGPPS